MGSFMELDIKFLIGEATTYDKKTDARNQAS